MIEQERFDPLIYCDIAKVDLEEGHKRALKARNIRLRELRSKGAKCMGWTLKNQLRKYKEFQVKDGRYRNMYYISIYDAATSLTQADSGMTQPIDSGNAHPDSGKTEKESK